MIHPSTGILLIADPFLKDPNFMRAVVLLCEHREEGSFGFVLTRKYNKAIGEMVSGMEAYNFPVFYGGPVQKDTLHFIHCCPALIDGGMEIKDGIFWGGNFEDASAALKNNKLKPQQIRFFIGYSGWSEGQLNQEMQEKTWLLTEASKKLVFHKNENLIWADALRQIGGEYEQLIHYPIDPQLN
jgi:putative transcriptional regulator